MPEKRPSTLQVIKEIERVCMEQAENIFNSAIKQALESRGYELTRILDGRIGKEDSDTIREQILRGERPSAYSSWIVEGRGGVQNFADFVVWHKEKGDCALIETTSSAIIQVKDNDIMPEMELFAEAWEKERPALLERLDTEFHENLQALGYCCQDFAKTITIIES